MSSWRISAIAWSRRRQSRRNTTTSSIDMSPTRWATGPSFVSGMLKPRYFGPYRVVELINKVVVAGSPSARQAALCVSRRALEEV